MSDLDVVEYAAHVRNIMTRKFTNARFARYASSTLQILLAAGAGAAAAFDGGTTLIATLAFGSAATPQISNVFKANERAGYYQTASYQIDIALSDYARSEEFDGTPNPEILTDAGLEPYTSVVASVQNVEAAISSDIPGLQTAEAAEADTAALRASILTAATEREKLREKLERLNAKKPTATATPTTSAATPNDAAPLPAG